MKYFTDCRTAEELKKAFHKAAAKLHPDNGGDAEEFKAMKAEFEKLWDRLKDVHTTKDGETYTATGEKATKETAAEFMDILEKVIHLDGIKIEIIGSWVWITGNTYEHRETIKAAGFFWSKSKKAWYHNGTGVKSTRRGRYSMNALRNHWGAQEVETETQPKLKPAYT